MLKSSSDSPLSPLQREGVAKGCLARASRLGHSSSVLLLEEQFASTSDGTSSLGSDETALLTAGSISSCCCWVTDVLMVTTTVGMLDGVHSDTSNSWPVSLLGVRSIVAGVGTEHGLVSSLATGNNANHGSAASEDGLTDT